MNSARIHPWVLPGCPKPNPHAPHPEKSSHLREVQASTTTRTCSPRSRRSRAVWLGVERGQTTPARNDGGQGGAEGGSGQEGVGIIADPQQEESPGVLEGGEDPRSGGEPRSGRRASRVLGFQVGEVSGARGGPKGQWGLTKMQACVSKPHRSTERSWGRRPSSCCTTGTMLKQVLSAAAGPGLARAPWGPGPGGTAQSALSGHSAAGPPGVGHRSTGLSPKRGWGLDPGLRDEELEGWTPV